MSAISSILARAKNDPQQFEDDTQIKEFLIELGIASQFKANVREGNPAIQSVPYLNHPSHFILVLLYSGYDSKENNGYILSCVPKSRASVAEFFEFAKKILNPTDDRIIEAGLFRSSPDNPAN